MSSIYLAAVCSPWVLSAFNRLSLDCISLSSTWILSYKFIFSIILNSKCFSFSFNNICRSLFMSSFSSFIFSIISSLSFMSLYNFSAYSFSFLWLLVSEACFRRSYSASYDKIVLRYSFSLIWMILCFSESIYFVSLLTSCLCVYLSSYRSILDWRSSFFSIEITYSIVDGSSFLYINEEDLEALWAFVDNC